MRTHGIKKIEVISVNDRKVMVNAVSDRSISWQCKALGVAPEYIYYKGNKVSERNHTMLQMLELYLDAKNTAKNGLLPSENDNY